MDINRKLLEEYRSAQAELKAAKEKEAQLRMEISDVLLNGKSEGTHNFIIDGFKVKAVNKMNYKVDESELNLIWEEMSPIERSLIRFKPALNLKDYKATEGDLLLNNAITVSPAMPTLSVEYKD